MRHKDKMVCVCVSVNNGPILFFCQKVNLALQTFMITHCLLDLLVTFMQIDNNKTG